MVTFKKGVRKTHFQEKKACVMVRTSEKLWKYFHHVKTLLPKTMPCHLQGLSSLCPWNPSFSTC